ncbi:MAG: lactate 2-monooxygenase [Bacteroidia bacterium]|nr:lactate 2-monooxygenase [Bacteroidia bacterium]
MPKPGRPRSQTAVERQREIYLDGVGAQRPLVPAASGESLEAAARRVMSPEAFAYVAGGAGLGHTLAANRAAFGRLQIVPRMLRNVEARSTSVELFGRTLPAPLLLAPVGVLDLAHPDAERAAARAAAALGLPMIFSSQASVPMEQAAAEMGDAPRWFQLYWSKSDELVASFVRRAEACGCEAIAVTLDTTLLGWRPQDLDLGYLPFLRGMGIAQYTSDPVFQRLLDEPEEAAAPSARPSLPAIRTLLEMVRRYPGPFWPALRSGRAAAAVRKFISIYSRPSLTWDQLGFLRAHTKLPVLLKGILHPDDARRALDAGMDGIIVSNHGGRQVDGAIAALDALPGILEAVADRVPVLMDSGVRSGADVFKALALGAKAVCIGRPYVYGLALGGEAGAGEVLRNLMAEFELTMGLAGCASVQEIGRECCA